MTNGISGEKCPTVAQPVAQPVAPEPEPELPVPPPYVPEPELPAAPPPLERTKREPKQPSKWSSYVKEYRSKNPDVSFKQALQDCSKTYKK